MADSADIQPREAGMTYDHIRAVAEQCRKDNLFLFVRPSTDDTRLLIEDGYATKSMDIHDKSSDWGPMAGMVPVDPEFSKKPPGKQPDLTPMLKGSHNEAHPVHLKLSPSHLGKLTNVKIRPVNDTGYTLSVSAQSSKPPILSYSSTQKGGLAPSAPEGYQKTPGWRFALYRADKAPNNEGLRRLFVMVHVGIGWAVYWAPEEKPGKPVALVPLVVWGYVRNSTLKPVTGDYDLWMVAPHLSRAPIELVHAVDVRPDEHGDSAVSGYTALLLQRLNTACKRADNPVFNHGAEAQNVGFTQAHDEKLVMFTASGRQRMVSMSAMPAVLGDLHKTGYVITLNKQWASQNPVLGGKSLGKRNADLNTLWGKVRSDIQGGEDDGTGLEALMATMTDIRKTRQSAEQIKAWYDQLAKQLEDHESKSLVGLRAAEMPQGWHIASRQKRELAYKIQQQMLAMTNGRAGSKQAGTVDSDQWYTWHQKNLQSLRDLRSYWGLK